MEDKLVEVIDTLSKKLSIAVPHLHEVLLKQAQIDAIVGIIGTIIGLFTIIVGIYTIIHTYKKEFAEKQKDTYHRWDECNSAKIFISTILCITILVIIIFTIGWTLTALLNPEYYIIKKILTY